MANPGNTGKRYRFRRVIGAEVNERGGITVTLDCGHVVVGGGPIWGGADTPEDARAKIGMRYACYPCARSGGDGG